MTKSHFEGDLRAPAGARYAIVASRWNPKITDTLVAGARRAFADHGVADDEVEGVVVVGQRLRVGDLPQEAQMAGVRARRSAQLVLVAATDDEDLDVGEAPDNGGQRAE